jgi:hypothetical protein
MRDAKTKRRSPGKNVMIPADNAAQSIPLRAQPAKSSDKSERIREEAEKYTQHLSKWRYLFEDIEDLPKNLDPAFLMFDISGDHSELAPYTDGTFFVEQARKNPDKAFDIWFVSKFNGRRIYFYNWDKTRLQRAIVRLPEDTKQDEDKWNDAHLGVLHTKYKPRKGDWITIYPEHLVVEHMERELPEWQKWGGKSREVWEFRQNEEPWMQEMYQYQDDWKEGKWKCPAHLTDTDNFPRNICERDPMELWPYIEGHFFIDEAKRFGERSYAVYFVYTSKGKYRQLFVYLWTGKQLFRTVAVYDEEKSIDEWRHALDDIDISAIAESIMTSGSKTVGSNIPLPDNFKFAELNIIYDVD